MADDSVVKLKIDNEVFEVDMNDLTLSEVGTVEDLCKRPAEDIDWQSARGIQGLVWIAVHRRNHRFSVEDAGNIKFTQMSAPDDEPEERPTKPRARARSGESSSSKA